jgi:3-hydroxymyristoyl/3-hydroxydecanoyl-(acyl carrier protein) dehydratase
VNREARFIVPLDHPCLPGHFPGAPMVPGVLLLEAALQAMGLDGTQPRALAWVKFLRPLLPAQLAVIRYHQSGGQCRFEVLHAGEVLARGAVSAAPGVAANAAVDAAAATAQSGPAA